MTTTTRVATTRPHRDRSSSAFGETIDWKTVSDSLWVGHRGSEYAGIVEQETPGQYTAFDHLGERMNTHPELSSAQDALEPATADRIRRAHLRDRAFMWTATATAVIAAAAATAALVVR